MKMNKKVLSLILSAALIAASFTVGIIAYAGSPVAINSVNFPDENFRTIIQLECDEDEDGYLSDSEVSGVTLFSVTGYLYDLDDDAEIESLKGIEYFTNLRTLRCGGIGLKSLDVSKLTQLTRLDCMGNELEELDVSKNTALVELKCESNELDSLNVSALTNLVKLTCSVNHLTEINVRNNTKLENLSVHQNELTSLDVSRNTALTSIHCSNNHIQELDLSANTQLQNVTSNRIGNQTIEGVATQSGDTVFVQKLFTDKTRIVSTSLDVENEMGLIGYSGDSFYTTDYTKLLDGIDYEYDTGCADAEPFTVHINVERDFFVVRFYTTDKKTTLIKQEIVNGGEDAVAPVISETPQCKTFVAWSDTFGNIHADKDIYATWKDDHVFSVTDFHDNTVVLECMNGCGSQSELSFFDYVGTRLGDSGYSEAVDINADGIINGKDLAYLKTAY